MMGEEIERVTGMGIALKDCFQVKATLVANEFIDHYMASANGEYVKVYLYLLRHQDENVDIADIADHLDHTEADVRRAVTYWTRMGVLAPEGELSPADSERESTANVALVKAAIARKNAARNSAARENGFGNNGSGDQGGIGAASENSGEKPGASGNGAVTYGTSEDSGVRYSASGDSAVKISVSGERGVKYSASGDSGVKDAAAEAHAAAEALQQVPEPEELPEKPSYSPYQLSRLSDNEEFAQLLYVAQKYTGTIFNHKDCEIFAYLYEELGMSFDLLAHLVATCVQSEHREVRYMEAVALNWHKAGVRTVDQAKQGTELYVKGYGLVMKAFGLSGRNPGTTEHDLIRKWFYTYMFSPTIVTEACNRTMRALHQPSFEYADKILSSWKEAGVRSLEDVKKLDQAREGERKQKAGDGKKGQAQSARADKNQFHNFKQRDTDYNTIVMERLKERLNGQANQQ